MSINVQCPGCGKALKGSEDLCGMSAKCPACGQQFAIAARLAPVAEPLVMVADSPATPQSSHESMHPISPAVRLQTTTNPVARQLHDGSTQPSPGPYRKYDLEPNLCPVCHTHTDGKPLRLIYDGYACRKCRNSLINRRALAWILDMIFLWIATYLLGFNLGFVLAVGGARIDADSAAAFGMLVGLIFSIFYLTKDGWIGGKSLGKGICGLKVVDRASLQPIGMGASFKRNLPLMIPFVPFVAAIQINSDDCHRIGEGWANTMVTFARTRT